MSPSPPSRSCAAAWLLRHHAAMRSKQQQRQQKQQHQILLTPAVVHGALGVEGARGRGGGENSLSSGKLLPLLPSSCCNSSGSHPLVGVSGWRQLMPATLSPPPPPPPPLPPPPPSFRPDPSSRRERAVEKLPKPSRGTCRVKRKMISAIRW